jgi:hypothetical protein
MRERVFWKPDLVSVVGAGFASQVWVIPLTFARTRPATPLTSVEYKSLREVRSVESRIFSPSPHLPISSRLSIATAVRLREVAEC